MIAEVKKASPSAGVIAKNFDPVEIAQEYEDIGASGLSVLTDSKFFQGNLSYIAQIRKFVKLPILRKDFIIDEVQIYESVLAGADAILLIVAALEFEQLRRLHDIALNYQLEVLVEVHDFAELDKALRLEDVAMIGINNRNLSTFEVDLNTTVKLSASVDEDMILVSESGISKAEDVKKLRSAGVDAFLVGEALMRAGDRREFMEIFRDEVE